MAPSHGSICTCGKEQLRLPVWAPTLAICLKRSFSFSFLVSYFPGSRIGSFVKNNVTHHCQEKVLRGS